MRISLSMASYPTVTSWLSNPVQYMAPMSGVIKAIGANPDVYVLISLRSDASMIGQDMADGDPEATGLPSDSTTTPRQDLVPHGHGRHLRRPGRHLRARQIRHLSG